MVTVLALLAVLAVLFGAAVLSTREGQVMADAPQDAADVVLPAGPLQPEDLAAVRFGMAPRGYRMSEVDAVLDRLGEELRDRDRRIALLEATVEGATPEDVQVATEEDLPVAAPAPVSVASAASAPPAEPPATVSDPYAPAAQAPDPLTAAVPTAEGVQDPYAAAAPPDVAPPAQEVAHVPVEPAPLPPHAVPGGDEPGTARD